MIKKIFNRYLIFSNLYGASFANTDEKKICTGFGKWTEDGEYKVVRSKCITEKEYEASLNAPDYLVQILSKIYLERI